MTTKKLIIRYLILFIYAIIIVAMDIGSYFIDLGFDSYPHIEVALYELFVMPVLLVIYGAISYKLTYRLLIPTLILLIVFVVSNELAYLLDMSYFPSFHSFGNAFIWAVIATLVAMTPITILVIMKKSEERSCRKKGKP